MFLEVIESTDFSKKSITEAYDFFFEQAMALEPMADEMVRAGDYLYNNEDKISAVLILIRLHAGILGAIWKRGKEDNTRHRQLSQLFINMRGTADPEVKSIIKRIRDEFPEVFMILDADAGSA